jgi:hypothetical protein
MAAQDAPVVRDGNEQWAKVNNGKMADDEDDKGYAQDSEGTEQVQ